MSVIHESGSNQAPLFVAGPESGLEHPSDLYLAAQEAATAENAVYLLARNLALQHTVRLFVPINRADNVNYALHAKTNHDSLVRRYGETGLAAVAANAKEKHRRLDVEARGHFDHAYGVDAIVGLEKPKAGGVITHKMAQAMARGPYAALKRRFGKPTKESEEAERVETERKKFLLELVRQEVILVTHEKGAEEPSKPKSEKTKLTNREKFEVLRDDMRAGFLPASNAEKTDALTLLDYIDNPDYPLATGSQLQEVFIHNKNENKDEAPGVGTRLGLEALRSLPLKFGDYLVNAVESINNLRGLELAVRECLNPNVTIEEELGMAPGVAELIRYIEQLEYRETGEPPKDVRFSLFRTHENRGSGHDDFKHKTVEDPYTGETLRVGVAKHLDRKIKTLKIGEIRWVISEAIEDQRRRAVFWEARLQETQQGVTTWRSGHWVFEKVQSLRSA